MASELFTIDGKRKYLSFEELERFLKIAGAQERGELRTFCLVLAYTGCRPMEALALTAENIDLSEKTIIFKTLKQRHKTKFRAIPIPDHVIDALELVHGIRKAQRVKKRAGALFPWKYNQAYKLVKRIMKEAGIEGTQATAKGLRHGFGVRAAEKTRNPRLVQKWLGHTSLENTLIYMDAIGQEERKAALSMWE
ncbi:MAG: tyrosine-type recombinase/integrase [Methylomarinum sp.]|nr:tyrosine-type recombinase/integrase [Methylomarinum sp.]